MIRKFLLIILTVITAVCFTLGISACSEIVYLDSSADSSSGTESSLGADSTGNEDSSYSDAIQAAYGTAQELGYSGTIEEFLAAITGADGADGTDGKDGADGADGTDGVGIAGVAISDGELVVTLTDETVINLGVIAGTDGEDGVGISSVTINSKGELVIKLTNGEEINCGNVVGADGNDGQDGEDITITGTATGEDSSGSYTEITFSDGSIIKIYNGADGKNGSSVTIKDTATGTDENGSYTEITFSDGSIIKIYNGADGKNGEDGADGADGKDGEDGADGATWYTGEGDPSAETGADGDLYLDTTTYEIYKKTDSKWTSIGNIKGATGEDGEQGTQGTQGEKGDTGDTGATGVGISNIEKTDTDGNVDTYTITLTNGDTYTFTVTNGEDGTSASGSSHTAIDGYIYDDCFHYFVCADCYEYITQAHTFEDGVCTVCGYEATYSVGLAYSLDSETKSYTVTGIGDCTDTEITIPSVRLGLPVTAIADNAFKDYTTITSVYIPDSITDIGSNAFSGCTSLASFTVSKNNTVYCSIDGNLCTADGTSVTLTQYALGSTSTSYTIPDSITAIGGYAFSGCTTLESVTIPSSITAIGSYAFSGCTALAVTIGGNEATIGDHAFYNCTALADVTIGEGVASIGSYAFYNCTALAAINFNATAMSGLSASNYVFAYAGNSGGITVTVGESVTQIPAYLFCPAVSTDYAPKILSITYSGTAVTSIGNYAFAYCSSLESIDIPDSVTTVGSYAFAYCSSATSITIGEGVKSLGDDAFSDCTAITIINFNAKEMNNLTSGTNAFWNVGTTEGTNIIIGTSVTKIPAYLFHTSNREYIPKIINVVFKEGSNCTNIGEQAFYRSEWLTSIVIPESVTTIENSAFDKCNYLSTVYYTGTADDWAKIKIGSNNTYLTNAKIYYYSEEEPAASGNYWYYDTDGNPAIWTTAANTNSGNNDE